MHMVPGGNKTHVGNKYHNSKINYVASKNQSFNNYTYKNNNDYKKNTTQYSKTFYRQSVDQLCTNNDKIEKSKLPNEFCCSKINNFNTISNQPTIITKMQNASCFEDKGIHSSSSSSSFSSTSSGSILQKSDDLYNLHAYIQHFLSKSDMEHTLNSLKKHIMSHPTFSNIDEKLIDTKIINFKELMDSRNMYLCLKNRKLNNSYNVPDLSTNMNRITTSTPLGSQALKFPLEKESKQNNSFQNNGSIDQNVSNEVKMSKSSICSLKKSVLPNNDKKTSTKPFGSKNNFCSNEELNKIFICTKNELHKTLLSNMFFLLRNYFCAINLNNLKFLYNRSFSIALEPNSFGFSSDEDLLKLFNGMIITKNSIIYPKSSLKSAAIHKDILNSYYNCFSNISIEDINCCKNYSQKNIDVTFKLDQEKLPITQISMDVMVLSEVYNPTLFFLHLAYKKVQFEQLSTRIQKFYGQEQEESKYLVNPEDIKPGRVFVSSYLSYSNIKHWNRVKVLKDINENSIQILQVDYGTIDCIPKSELRLMKTEFSVLPGQAIQCCLTGYNEISSMPVRVTEAFIKLTNNKELDVHVDHLYQIDISYQVIHVTLFVRNNIKDKNINNELTLNYL